MKTISKIFIGLFFCIAGCSWAQESSKLKQTTGMYLERLNSLLINRDTIGLRLVLNDLNRKRKNCCYTQRPIADFYYLIGRLQCELNEVSGADSLRIYLRYKNNLDHDDIVFIKDCIDQCESRIGNNRTEPMRVHKKQFRSPNTHGVGGGGSSKNNQPNTPAYLNAIGMLFDTAKYNKYSLADYYQRSFGISEKDTAITYYMNLVKGLGYEKQLCKVDKSQHFVMFHSKKDEGKSYLKALEKNLDFWTDSLKVNEPEELMVIFMLPMNNLTAADKQFRKGKYCIQWPNFNHGIQTQDVKKRFRITRNYRPETPLYLLKRDFLQFTFKMDGVILNEGDVGYSNIYDNSIFTLRQNSIGALNHEVWHQLIEVNYPSCNLWINEGMACLYETAKYDCEGNLKPINSFRLNYIKDIEFNNELMEAVLAKSWEELSPNDLQLNLAITRYVCFYLESKKLLQPFLSSLFSEANEGIMHTNSDIMNRMLSVAGSPSIKEFSIDFTKFVKEQVKIAYKNRKLKKQYRHGQYRDGRFH